MKLNSQKRKRNFRLDSVIFLFLIMGLVFTLYCADGGITGADVLALPTGGLDNQTLTSDVLPDESLESENPLPTITPPVEDNLLPGKSLDKTQGERVGSRYAQPHANIDVLPLPTIDNLTNPAKEETEEEPVEEVVEEPVEEENEEVVEEITEPVIVPPVEEELVEEEPVEEEETEEELVEEVIEEEMEEIVEEIIEEPVEEITEELIEEVVVNETVIENLTEPIAEPITEVIEPLFDEFVVEEPKQKILAINEFSGEDFHLGKVGDKVSFVSDGSGFEIELYDEGGKIADYDLLVLGDESEENDLGIASEEELKEIRFGFELKKKNKGSGVTGAFALGLTGDIPKSRDTDFSKKLGEFMNRLSNFFNGITGLPILTLPVVETVEETGEDFVEESIEEELVEENVVEMEGEVEEEVTEPVIVLPVEEEFVEEAEETAEEILPDVGVEEESYIKFITTSDQDLILDGEFSVKYLVDEFWQSFDDWNDFPVYKWKVLDFSDLLSKNPGAELVTNLKNNMFTVECTGCSDLDPTIVESFTSDLGGTYNQTEWVSADAAIKLQSDAVYIGKYDINATTDQTVLGANIDEDYSTFDNDGILDQYHTLEDTDGHSAWVTGKIGNALEFDGDGDGLSVTTNDFNTADATWSWWFKTRVTGGTFGMANLFKGNDQQFWVYIDNLNRVVLYDDIEGDNSYENSQSKVSIGDWDHFTIVFFTNGTKDFYHNGSYVFTDEDGASLDSLPAGTIFYLGRSGQGVLPGNGTIDEFKIWNRSLSPTEIANLYDNESSTTEDPNMDRINITAEWKFDGTGEEVLTDWDMEDTDGDPTSAWTAGNSANLTKQLSNFHRGNQSIRVQYIDTASPYAQQASLAVGKTYQITGWGRGDGSNTWRVTGGVVIVVGTESTDWQYFNDTFTATSGNFRLQSLADGAGYAEFDDVSIREVVYGEVTQDSSVNAHTGSLTGTYTRPVFNSTSGYYGTGAYEFDGLDDNINLGNDGSLDSGDGNSFAFWVKPAQAAGAIYNRNTQSATDGYHWINLNSNTLSYQYANSTDAVTVSSGAITWVLGEWFHVVVVHDNLSKTITFYVNGTSHGATTYTDTAYQVDSGMAYIGDYQAQGGGTYAFNGSIDNFIVFNRTLNETEILDIYNGSKAKHGYIPAYRETGNYTSPSLDGNISSVWQSLTLDGLFDNDTAVNRDTSDSDLVGWWTLDNTTDDLLHLSNGTNVGTQYDSRGINGSYVFDGADDYVSFGGVNIGTVHTISMWLKHDILTGTRIALGDSSNKYSHGFDATKMYYNADVDVVSITYTPTAGNWEHAVITRNDQDVNFYIDGVQVETTQTLTNNENMTINYVGSETGSASFFDGQIDEVKLWNRTLTAAEVAEEYRRSRGNKVEVEFRTSVDNSTWSDWYSNLLPNLQTGEVTLNSSIPAARYGQYRLLYNTTDEEYSGLILNISRDYNTSGNVTNAPGASSVVLNSTLGTNLTSENLTFYWSIEDEDGDDVKNITNWKLNGTSITVLNMPFEKVSDSVYNATKDYSGNDNNGSEFFNDSSGNSMDGWNATGGYDGKGAYEFDGDGDCITGSGDIFSGGSNGVAFSAWIKTTHDGIIVSSGGFLSFYRFARLEILSGKATIYVYNGGMAPLATSTTDVDDGNWHHIVGTGISNTPDLKIYVDGVLEGTDTTGGSSQYATEWTLGCGGHSELTRTRFFNGTIDDVQVFNKVLTPNQVKALYHNRTDVISFNETTIGDNWTACITPNDGVQDGAEVCNGDEYNITIQSAPVVSNMVLNSTLGTNLTSENLTVYWDSVDADYDDVKNITNWKLNGTSIAVLNMPFEKNETGTNTKDYSGFGNDGTTISGDPVWGSNYGYDGKGAYEFDGVGDYIRIDNDASLSFGTGDFSISVWFKTNVTDNNFHKIIETTESASSTYGMMMDNNNKFSGNVRNENGSTSVTLTSSALESDTWYHGVLTKNSTNCSLYLGGISIDEDDCSDLDITPGDEVYIGSQLGNFYYWNGTIDDVQILNYSLSAEQVKILYENRTDMMAASDTSPADNWTVCITPNDGVQDGAEVCNDDAYNITIQSAPVVSNMVLNSTLGTNLTSENLTVYWDSTDVDSDDVKNITNWKLNGTSIAVLNMPFEKVLDSVINATKDYSGNGYNGTEINGPTWNATGGYDGKGAYEFVNADSGYIELGTISLGTTHTISAWVKGNTNNQIVIGSGGTSDYAFYLASNAWYYNAGGAGAIGWSDTPDANWHHYVISRNESDAEMFIDGVSQGTQTLVANNNLSLSRIGTSGAYYWDGTIDDVMFFNKSLSAEEVTAIYENKSYILTASETSPADNWSVCITPNDGVQDGTEVCNDDAYNITIQSAPVVSNVVLNSTLGTNLTTENLTIYWSDSDADYDDVKNITNWKLNGTSITLLNMPFEKVSDSVINATKDYSTFDNNGSETGGVTFNATGGYDGKGAYYFDGDDDVISIADASSLSFTDGSTDSAFSVSMWVNADDFTSFSLISKGLYNTNGEYEFFTFTDDKLYVRLMDESVPSCHIGRYYSVALTSKERTWTHLAMTYNGNATSEGIDLYLNGAVVDNGDYEANGGSYEAMEDLASDVWVGRSNVAGYANGTIDDVQIFNRSLSQEEITAIYENKSYIMAASDLSEADNWTACITPNDGVQDGIEVCNGDEYNITIQSAPVASSVNITSNDGLNTTNSTLYGNWSYSDADSDPETGNETKWFNNSVEVVDLQNFTAVHSDNTTKTQNWTFSVRLYDGVSWGSWVNSTTNLTVENTPPQTTQVDLNFSSTRNHTSDDLICWAQFADNDSDSIYANYTWFRDGEVHSAGQTTDTFEVGTLVNIINLSHTNTGGGENWTCQVEAYDGTDYEGEGTNFSGGVIILTSAAAATTTTETAVPYSGGGGGGGSFDTRTSYSEWFEVVEKGQTVVVRVPQIEGIEKVEFETVDDLEKQWMVIKKMASPPADFPNNWYNIFKIDSLKITDYLKRANIYFNVNKKWLDEHGLGRFDVTLYRWAGYYWQELPVIFRGIDDTYVRYMATTPRFSYFLIGEKGTSLPSMGELLEMDESQEEEPSEEKQLAIEALTLAEKTLKQIFELGVIVEEAEKKMAEAQSAYLGGNYQQALTLAQEARLLAEKAMPEIEQPTSLSEMISSKINNLFDKIVVVGRTIVSKVKSLFNGADLQYWLVGASTLLIVLVGIFLSIVLKNKKKKKPIKKPAQVKKSARKSVEKKVSGRLKDYKDNFQSKIKNARAYLILGLILLFLIGGVCLLMEYCADSFIYFRDNLFSLADSVKEKVISFVVGMGNTLGPLITETGKDISSSLSFTGFSVAEMIPFVSSWLPILLTVLIIVGMLVYIFRSKKASKNS